MTLIMFLRSDINLHITSLAAFSWCNLHKVNSMSCPSLLYRYCSWSVDQRSWLWMCKTGKNLHSVSPALPQVLTAADYQHKPQLQLFNVSAEQTWRRLIEWRKTEFSLSVWWNQMLVAVWTGESIEMLTNLSLWLQVTGCLVPYPQHDDGF